MPAHTLRENLTLKNIFSCLAYSFSINLTAFIFSVISMMGFRWLLTSTSLSDPKILSYVEQLEAILAGSGAWFLTCFVVTALIDIFYGSRHLSNLVNRRVLAVTRDDDPTYSRLSAIMKRLSPTICVPLLIWLFGWIIGLSNAQLSELWQSVAIGLTFGSTVALFIGLPALALYNYAHQDSQSPPQLAESQVPEANDSQMMLPTTMPPSVAHIAVPLHPASVPVYYTSQPLTTTALIAPRYASHQFPNIIAGDPNDPFNSSRPLR